MRKLLLGLLLVAMMAIDEAAVRDWLCIRCNDVDDGTAEQEEVEEETSSPENCRCTPRMNRCKSWNMRSSAPSLIDGEDGKPIFTSREGKKAEALYQRHKQMKPLKSIHDHIDLMWSNDRGLLSQNYYVPRYYHYDLCACLFATKYFRNKGFVMDSDPKYTNDTITSKYIDYLHIKVEDKDTFQWLYACHYVTPRKKRNVLYVLPEKRESEKEDVIFNQPFGVFIFTIAPPQMSSKQVGGRCIYIRKFLKGCQFNKEVSRNLKMREGSKSEMNDGDISLTRRKKPSKDFDSGGTPAKTLVQLAQEKPPRPPRENLKISPFP